MKICGIQKLSLLDYPEKLAATIFTGGCNFRCPFCHNAPLVTELENCVTISEDYVLDFLKTRIGKLDGICITGGEPLIHNDIDNFIRKVRDLGFLVKLDTNGTFPERLGQLLEKGLLDYVAMDIKNSAEKYSMTVGIADFDITSIKESIELLINCDIPYEFRTTLVKGFQNEDDIRGIGKLVKGAQRHFLQNFEDSGDLVGFSSKSQQIDMCGFSRKEIEHFQEILAFFVPEVEIRG